MRAQGAALPGGCRCGTNSAIFVTQPGRYRVGKESSHRTGVAGVGVTGSRVLASARGCFVALAGTTAPWPHSHARSSRRGTVLTRFRLARHSALDEDGHRCRGVALRRSGSLRTPGRAVAAERRARVSGLSDMGVLVSGVCTRGSSSTDGAAWRIAFRRGPVSGVRGVGPARFDSVWAGACRFELTGGATGRGSR